MGSIRCVDESMNLVIGGSDAKGKIIGRTMIVEKKVSLLFESDGRFRHTHRLTRLDM